MVVLDRTDWGSIEQSVRLSLEEVIDRLQGYDIEPSPEMVVLSSVPGVRAQVDEVCAHIMTVLETRGRSYGEDVLLLLDEMGFVAWVVSKALRLLWSYTAGLDASSRQDDWVDLAGYAILRLAVKRQKEKVQDA